MVINPVFSASTWLTQPMKGHKRWEKATNTGYESVRRLTHENLLPALERFTIIVSRLRGLSKFQVSNDTLGLSTRDLDSILDTVNCLQFMAHCILIAAGSELSQFQAFSGWLRQEIDIQATNAVPLENIEKDTNIDYSSTLKYIQGPMMHSQLVNLFDLKEQGDNSLRWDLAEEGRSLFELYKSERQGVTKEESIHMRLPGLSALIEHVKMQCESVFDRIAETQRRNIRFGSPISIGVGIPTCTDMRTVVEVSKLTGGPLES